MKPAWSSRMSPCGFINIGPNDLFARGSERSVIIRRGDFKAGNQIPGDSSRQFALANM
jgi:hypothetical protein